MCISGALIKRLKGHESNIEMFSITDGPIFASYGCWEEENAIKLWSTETLDCIASFKLDCAASDFIYIKIIQIMENSTKYNVTVVILFKEKWLKRA